MDLVVLQALGPGESIGIKAGAGIVVSVSSILIAWYARKIHKDWEDRAEKVDELYQAFFGMEEVSTMEGVVEVVETHENDIQRHDQQIDELREKVQEIEDKKRALKDKVDRLRERVEQREEET